MVYRRRRRTRKQTSHSKITKVVNKILEKRTEVKHDAIRVDSNLDVVPVALNIVDYIRQGESSEQREGNRLNLLSFSLRGICTQADVPFNFTRIALVETREPLPLNILGQDYNASTLFQDLGFCGTNSYWNYNIVKKIYWDKSMVLRQKVLNQNDARIVNVHIKFGSNGKKIYYDGQTSATLGEATRTYLYLVMMSDSTSPLSNPVYNACAYLRYIDL